MKIALDIGGVVKSMTSDEPVAGAREGIDVLKAAGHKIVFISKCAAEYRRILHQWLEDHDYLDRVLFCDDYEDKLAIARREEVQFMVDDKMQVLRNFVGVIPCVWFCTEPHRIAGAWKYQPEFMNQVAVAADWDEIVNIITG